VRQIWLRPEPSSVSFDNRPVNRQPHAHPLRFHGIKAIEHTLQIRWINRSSSKSRVAVSSHCKSSRNRANGCSRRANTLINRRSTRWNRRCASCDESSGTGGCSPMMSFNSGTRYTINCAFGSKASRIASRQPCSSGSLLTRSERTRL